MFNATQISSQGQSPERVNCPTWCINTADGRLCDGDHLAEDDGTLATGGRPPAYSGQFESRPHYDAVSVTPQYPEADGLRPNVGLLTVVGGRDIAVELTPTEAERLGRALLAATALVQGHPGAVWPPAALSATTAEAHEQVDLQTVIRTLVLPEGQDCVLYPDANVVGLSSRLDDAGRERAFMGPDDALCRLRQAFGQLDSDEGFHDAMTVLSRNFRVLDEWLSKGGIAPSDWREGSVSLSDGTSKPALQAVAR